MDVVFHSLILLVATFCTFVTIYTFDDMAGRGTVRFIYCF